MFVRRYDNVVMEKVASLNREHFRALCELEDLTTFSGSFCRTFLFKGVKDDAEALLRLLVFDSNHTKLQFVESVFEILMRNAFDTQNDSTATETPLEPHPFPEFLNKTLKSIPESSMRVLRSHFDGRDIAQDGIIISRMGILKTIFFDAYRLFNKVAVVKQGSQPFVVSGEFLRYYSKSLSILATRYKTIVSSTDTSAISFSRNPVLERSRDHLFSVVLAAVIATYDVEDSIDLREASSGLDKTRWLNIFMNDIKREVDYVQGEQSYHEMGSDKRRFLMFYSSPDQLKDNGSPRVSWIHERNGVLLLAAHTHMEYVCRETSLSLMTYYTEPGSHRELFESGLMAVLFSQKRAQVQIREYFGYFDKDYLMVNGASEDSEEFLPIWKRNTLDTRFAGLLRTSKGGSTERGLARTCVLYHLRIEKEEGAPHDLYLYIPVVQAAPPSSSEVQDLLKRLYRGESVSKDSLKDLLIRKPDALKGSVVRAILEHPTAETLLKDALGSNVSSLRMSDGSVIFRMTHESYELEFQVEGTDATSVRVFENQKEIKEFARFADHSTSLNYLFLEGTADVSQAYRSTSEAPSAEKLPKALQVKDGSRNDSRLSSSVMPHYARWCVKSPESDWSYITNLFDLERSSLEDLKGCAQNVFCEEMLRALTNGDFRSGRSAFHEDARRMSAINRYEVTVFMIDLVRKKEGVFEDLMRLYDKHF